MSRNPSPRPLDAPDKERSKDHKKRDSKHRRSSRIGRSSRDSAERQQVSRESSDAPLPPPPATPVDPVAHLHPLLWTEADVALWLQFIGEGGLISCFDVINGVLLVNLDEEQLTNLGVVNPATRQKLMAAIGEVKERSQKVNIKELKEKRKRDQEILQDKESAAFFATPVQYSLPKEVSSWSVADVGTFLDYIEIPDLKSKFASKAINGNELLRLTDQSLISLGVDKLGHRKKILRCARQLHEGVDPNVEPPTLKPTTTLQVSFRCRFGTEVQVLNTSGVTSLATVRQQLNELFRQPITQIRWRDAQGDLITMLNDDDLQDACHLSEERNIVDLYLSTQP